MTNCPTCGRIMIHIGHTRLGELGMKVLWCERCGTVNFLDGSSEHHHRPMLVSRCRDFESQEYTSWSAERNEPVTEAPDRWRTLGIAEAIHNPTEAP